MTVRRFNNFGGPSLHGQLVEMIDGAERRLWIKIPWWDTSAAARVLLDATVRAAARGIEVQVLSRPEASNDAAHRELRSAGVRLVPIRYIHEKELLADGCALTHSMNFTGAEIGRNQNSGTLTDDVAEVEAIEAGFGEVIAAQAAAHASEFTYTRSDTLIPSELQKYMTRHRSLNPLQSEAVPQILATSGHVMVVAPTGAGKTLIGEVAVLRSIVSERRPAVWLLPARALAAEVAEAARRWRHHGITTVELTGESNISSAAVQRAQLWIATTEKFEALYRRSSLREHIGRVGCIVIDEVHLVGDPQRGATLESLIARLRAVSERTRIVALSATVANAQQLADWFHAQLITSTWRPTTLTRQLVPYTEPPGGKGEQLERVKDSVLRALLASFTEQIRDRDRDDGGPAGGEASVLVFCGSKNNVRRTAAMAAHLDSFSDDEQLVAACFAQGVGIHFRDAPHTGRALTAFKDRTIHTLIATSGLSTGVNTPARIVVIRDLELGMSPLEVSQAQQMLGRAGRAGQESEGFGFVMVPDNMASLWRHKLRGGYTARSQVADQLTDVILAEILLGSITDRLTAVAWFEETFAYAQSADPLQADGDEALDFLVSKGFVADTGTNLSVTALGALTSRLMVPARSAAAIVAKLTEVPVPASADEAEELVLAVMAGATEQLRDWPVNKRVYQPFVERFLQSWSPRALGPINHVFGAQFCLAAAHLALRNPRALHAKPAAKGVSVAEFRRAVDDMPRYLAWISALGYLDREIAVWAPAVAGDLARRLTWWTLTPHPQRGTGRLLWLLENTLHPENRRAAMSGLWRRATDRGFRSPDNIARAPDKVDVSGQQFTELIDGRATLDLGAADTVTVPVGTVTADARLRILTDSGSRQATATVQPVPATVTVPVPHGSRVGPLSADLFLYTRAGDFAYRHLVTIIPADAVAHTDPVGEATAAIAQLQPAAFVANPVGRVKRLLMSDRRRQAAIVAPRIAADAQLLPVAQALAEHDADPVAAVIAMRRNIIRLLDKDPSGDRGSVVAVLQSGHASPSEREMVLVALLNTLGFDVGIASVNRALAALIYLAGSWQLVTLSIDHGTEVYPLIPATLPPRLGVVTAPAHHHTEVAPRCLWATHFTAVDVGRSAAQSH